MRIAVVDMGTNSTRLLVADVEPGGDSARSSASRSSPASATAWRRRRLGPTRSERVLGVVERSRAVIAEQGASGRSR